MSNSRPDSLSVYDGRWVLSGRSGSSFMWVDLAWSGQDEGQPYRLPDGRDYPDVIADGEFSQIADQVWLSVTNAGKAQDMLWTTAMAFPVVSDRMADALVSICGEGAFEVHPVTVRRRRSTDLGGYAVLIPTGQGVDRRVREFPLGHRATSSLDMDAGVLEQLRARSIEGFESADARELAEALADESATSDQPTVLTDPTIWSVSSASGATRLSLTLDASVIASMIELPRGVLPTGLAAEGATENSDGSLSLPSGTATLSRPVAKDATGTPVGAFWLLDEGHIIVNVDHISGSHRYPVVVDASVG